MPMWRAMAAARVSRGVGERENIGRGSGCPCPSLSMARRRPSMTSAAGKAPYPAAFTIWRKRRREWLHLGFLKISNQME
jgi:hypothetical protein